MPPSASALSEGLFRRHPGNPLLTPQRWPYTINAVMNAGAALVDGETVLLCRVEDRRGFSDLTVARSHDGFSNWVVDTTPLLAPTPGVVHESWGLEDARLTWVAELDAWIIAYTTFGPGGPSLSLARTRDFRTAERLGMVRAPEDKNGALLSRRVNGEWVLFHRPVTALTARADIWLSRSPDLHSWSAPEPVLAAREGGWWDSARIGIGAPPMETPEGWLLVYHGVRQTVAGALYRMGAALLDLDEPWRVIARPTDYLLSPQVPYEQVGDVPNVVFPCAELVDEAADRLTVYYGGADTVVCMAHGHLSELLTFVRS